LTAGKSPALVLAADEGQERLSALFDPSTRRSDTLADGGGALWLSKNPGATGPAITLTFFKNAVPDTAASIAALVDSIDREQPAQERYALILAGMPAAFRNQAEKQLTSFLSRAGFCGPVVDYRTLIGEFQSASAVAAALDTVAAQVKEGSLSWAWGNL